MAEKLSWPEVMDAITVLRQVPEQSIRGCLLDYPEDWGIPAADVDAITTRLLESRDKIEDIIARGNPNVRARS
jgi:hypothetical protein